MKNRFSQAVLIIRDPYLAIQAEFNRQSGGHIGHAQPDKYTRDGGRCKYAFVKRIYNKYPPNIRTLHETNAVEIFYHKP